jgi:aminoglycoside phosphotransferase (APT) family kinase protein
VEWPAAEIEVDEALVRELLRRQHPDLAPLALLETGAGWDNTLWRLGPDLLVRLPRRASAAPLAANEQRWLPELGPRLPLPVPAPVRIGRATDRFPWPWSVVPWFDGVPGDRATISEPDDAALRLGRFLEAMHHEADAEAPENPWRGVALTERQDTFDERLGALAAEVDVGATREVWDRAVRADRWAGPPVWLHGDMHPANTLIAGGTLAAVIDFGDICRGDPASDLAGAWMLLPASAMDSFQAGYGALDDALEKRSLGWAVLFGLMLLGIGLRDRPSYEIVGRSTLDKVIRHGAA